MKYSVVIILNQPRLEINETIKQLSRIFSETDRKHEFVLVANGFGVSQVDSMLFDELGGIDVKVVHFSRHVTTGMAVSGALAHCDGDAIMTSAPYIQLSGEDIISLLDVFEQGVDMVIPWRKNRVDPKINQFQSRLFNLLVQMTTKVGFNDLSCPLRIFRKEILDSFHLYGDLYRYLPIMAAKRAFKVVEKRCLHLHEEGETGFYSTREYVGRLLDFLTFHFDIFSSRKPLRYFGKRALFFILPGSVLLLFLFAGASLGFFGIGNSPWLIISLVLLLLGVTFWSVGLLGELIVFAMGRSRKEYIIEKVTGE
jgi:hypothetical protein